MRPAPDVDGDLARLEHPTETALAIAVETETHLGGVAGAGDWNQVWRRWDELRPAIDRFFVDVLVMAEDPELRAARLTLLRRLDACFQSLADFSKIVCL